MDLTARIGYEMTMGGKGTTKISWIIGRGQKWRDQKLNEELTRLGESDFSSGFICLAPTKRRALFLKERFLQFPRPKRIWSPQIVVLRDLVENLFEEVIGLKEKVEILDEAKRLTCVEEAIVHLRVELEYFHFLFDRDKRPRFAEFPGIIERIANFITFIHQNILEVSLPEKLVLDASGNAGPKDNDLTHILNTFDRLLKENQLYDLERQYKAVLSQLKKGTFKGYWKNQVLVLDTLLFLNPLEEEFLKELAKEFRHIIITLDYDRGPEDWLKEAQAQKDATSRLNYRIYRHMESFAEALLKERTCEHHTLRAKDSEDLSIAKERATLLDALDVSSSPTSPVTLPPSEAKAVVKKAALEIHSLPNRVEEITFVCREIKKLLLEGVSAERILAVFPRIEPYISIIYEIFPQYGIPFSITRGMPLSSAPLAVVLRSMLKIPQGFHREDLFHFFTSTLISQREPIDAARFEAFIDKYKIGEHASVMKRQEILERFNAYLEEQKAKGFKTMHFDVLALDRFARSANIHGGRNLFEDWFLPLDLFYFKREYFRTQEDETDLERVKRRYLRTLRQLFLLDGIIAEFDIFNQKKSPAEVISYTKDLIKKYNISRNVSKRIEGLRDISPTDQIYLLRRDMQSFYKILEILENFLDELALKEKLGSRGHRDEVPLRWVERRLKKELAEQVIRDPDEQKVVQVTESLELRGIDCDYAFFGGLNAGQFPRLQEKDFIIPETPHARFRILNRTNESYFLFFHALKNTEKNAYLTYPRTDEGQELEKSSLVEDLLCLAPGLESIESSRQNPKLLLSREELLRALARFVPTGEASGHALWPKEFPWLLAHCPEKANIKRSIEVELSRRVNTHFGAYDGVLPQFNFNEWSGKEPVFSVSQLEEFAVCPQRYFYDRVLGLEPLDELRDQMEADEYGNLVHRILEEFYKEWRNKGHKGLPPNEFKTALNLMAKVATRLLDEFKPNIENILWDIQKVRIGSGLEDESASKTSGILRAFLEHERELYDPRVTPETFELTFGFTNDPVKIGDLPLRGKIDRIDRVNAADEMGSAQGYRLIDYKTGRLPLPRLLSEGLTFQLPVYLMVMKALSATSDHISPYFGTYYKLANPSEVGFEQPLYDGAFSEIGLEAKTRPASPREFYPQISRLIEERIRELGGLLRRGVFHYAFSDLRCSFCDYKNICRRDIVRLNHVQEKTTESYYIPQRNRALFGDILEISKKREKLAKLRERFLAGEKLKKDEKEQLTHLLHLFKGLPSTWKKEFAPLFERLGEQS